MKTPNKSCVIEDCLNCVDRQQRLFCNLPDSVIAELQEMKVTAVYPRGALICLEGQEPRGIFILCKGRAKLTTTSAEGKSIILRIAEPGEIIGLSAVLSNSPYEATAEIIEAGQANFISRADFLQFIRNNSEVGLRAADQLTRNCQCAYDEIRSIGLSKSAPEKLARLILKWSGSTAGHDGKAPSNLIRVTLTQEEIGQMVSSSRETVSRTLAEFRENGWLRTKGIAWTILDRKALENLVTA